jgi:hypothetical protein
MKTSSYVDCLIAEWEIEKSSLKVDSWSGPSRFQTGFNHNLYCVFILSFGQASPF